MRQVSSAAMASGSGIVPDDNFQEPVHGQRDNSNATASPSDGDGASPSPPPAAPVDPPQERLRQQAGSGTNESTSAAAGVDENGKKPASPSPPRSAGRSPSTTSSSSSDSTSLGGVGTVDRKKVFKKLVPEAEKKKPEGGQVKSSHPKKSLWSKCKSSLSRKKKIDGEGSQMGWEHVDHQTFPISEVGKHYRATKDRPILLNLDAFSRIRRVLGDGECFYRSFIYSYLEQVLDRQDTHEEQRLLDTVKRVSKKHRNLGWATEFRFRRSYKEMHNYLTVVACHHSFTHCWHKLKFEVYCKVNNPILTAMNLKRNLLAKEQ